MDTGRFKKIEKTEKIPFYTTNTYQQKNINLPERSVTPHLCLPLKPGNLREHCQGWFWDVLPDPPNGIGGKIKKSVSDTDDEAPCVLLKFLFPRAGFFL